MIRWHSPLLRFFAQKALDSGFIYYLERGGEYAAMESDNPEYGTLLPLWVSEKASTSRRDSDWQDFVVHRVPVDRLLYFKDDFVMNGWAAACYGESLDDPFEAPFISIVAAIVREEVHRGIRKRPVSKNALATAMAGDYSGVREACLREILRSFISTAKENNAFGHLSSAAELDAFDAKFPGVMPAWYRDILASVPIGDVTFEGVPIAACSWIPFGHFRDAATLLVEIAEVFPDEHLSNHGYLSIGAAGNGDCWVIKSKSTPADPVYLCFQSAYGGGDPAGDNCLFEYAPNFAAFIEKIRPDPNVF